MRFSAPSPKGSATFSILEINNIDANDIIARKTDGMMRRWREGEGERQGEREPVPRREENKKK